MVSWFDNEAHPQPAAGDKGIDWARVLPFIGLHLGCLGVIWVGISTAAVMVAVALYALRMFAITAFYHRYFSHAAFRTSRAAQLVFAVWGAT
ncbi:MAG: acyl-CoA desaturase, partial [Betaproteobacteria bacterium]|nr:acyl-CoA desaturase [Betaproteobacteria bacterium]